MANYRNETYRRAVAQLPCAKCGIHGASQCAHANSYVFGKGMGIKSHDWATFGLCHEGANGCHPKHDQYLESMTKSERIDYEYNLIGLAMQQLKKLGLISDELFEEVICQARAVFSDFNIVIEAVQV